MEKLKNSDILLFGVGGVGSFVAEALVRSGVGNLTIVDNDDVCVTNINRKCGGRSDLCHWCTDGQRICSCFTGYADLSICTEILCKRYYGWFC